MINVSFNTGKKSLVKGSVPRIFKFKQVEIKKKRKSPTKCFVVESESETSEYDESSTSAGEISDIYNNDDDIVDQQADSNSCLKMNVLKKKETMCLLNLYIFKKQYIKRC